MIDKKTYAALGAIVFIVGTAFAVDARYENRVSSAKIHELIAAEQEVGKLETELKLLELDIRLLRGIEENRSLTPEETDRRDYLKQRKMLIEARLLNALKTA
jgi:hypothetical protein